MQARRGTSVRDPRNDLAIGRPRLPAHSDAANRHTRREAGPQSHGTLGVGRVAEAQEEWRVSGSFDIMVAVIGIVVIARWRSEDVIRLVRALLRR
jgi:hypothetical protein